MTTPIPPTSTAVLSDVLGPGLKVVFCGLNPGLSSAALGYPFANPSNRFWRVLFEAGFTSRLLTAAHYRELLEYDCGLTAIVQRATARASDVAPSEFSEAAAALHDRLLACSPTHVAFLGKAGIRAILKTRSIAWGLQSERFADAKTWILPNTSGLNRATLPELVSAYRVLHAAAFGKRGRSDRLHAVKHESAER